MSSNETKLNRDEVGTLRRRAEQILQDQRIDLDQLSVEDTQQLIQELQVHQTELELQNEELRRIQLELEESRNKYTNLYDFAPVGYMTLDEQGHIVETNLTAARQFNILRRNLLQQPLAHFVAPEDQDSYHFWRRNLLSDQEPQSCELRLAGRNRSQLYVQLQGIPIPDDTGGRHHCLVTISDITGLKEAEMALRETEERFRRIFEQGPLGMTIVDRQNRFMAVNTKLCQVLGYSGTELIGRSFSEITHPEDIDEGEQVSARIFRGELSHGQVEKRYLTKDRRQIWVRITAAGIYYAEANTPMYLLGMIEDVTERRELQNRLAEERHLLRTIIDNLPDYVYVKDMESRFITGNQAVAALMGAQTPADLAGQTDFDFYPQELAAQYYEDEQNIFRLGEPLINKEEPVIDPAGKKYLLSTTKVPLKDQAGKVIGLVGIGRDITLRKRVENEKTELLKAISRQREELRALTARLAEVQESERQSLARELHDKVGQNLTALGFNLNFIQMQVAAPAAKLDRIDLVKDRLNDSLLLVEETTDRIRDVMAELRPPVLDDYGLVDALEWYSRRLTERVGLNITIWGEPINPRLSPAVENALFRIAQEALTNVAKHARAGQATVSVEVDDRMISLMIADDGLGFEPDQLAEARGQPYLGLLTIKERADAIGGRSRIISRPGQGTQVIVEVAR